MSAGPPKVPRNPYVATGLNFSDIAKSPGARAMVEQSIASDVVKSTVLVGMLAPARVRETGLAKFRRRWRHLGWLSFRRRVSPLEHLVYGAFCFALGSGISIGTVLIGYVAITATSTIATRWRGRNEPDESEE